MGRVDEISKYYKASDVLDAIANVLFYTVAASAILLTLLATDGLM